MPLGTAPLGGSYVAVELSISVPSSTFESNIFFLFFALIINPNADSTEPGTISPKASSTTSPGLSI